MTRAGPPASSASAPAQPAVKPFVQGMRSPVVGPLTRFLLGLPLFLLATQTDRFFAWTIAVPLTAAFLGACYWSSAVLAVLASRQAIWAFGRVSISVALVFAPLITVATFIHLEQFHLDSFFGWFWLVAYVIYCPMLAFFLYRQLQTPGGDPARTASLAGWVRAILAAHAIVLIPLGLALFLAPAAAGGLWPWPLTPLTGRVVGAWVLAIGVLAAHQLFENDLERVKIALFGYPILGALQAIALARYPGDMEWSEPGAWVFVAYVASMFVLGAYGLVAARGRVVASSSLERRAP